MTTYRTTECPTHGHAPDMGQGCAFCANAAAARTIATMTDADPNDPECSICGKRYSAHRYFGPCDMRTRSVYLGPVA